MKGPRARHNFKKEAKKAKSRMVHGLALELKTTITRFQLISLVWGFSEIFCCDCDMEQPGKKNETAMYVQAKSGPFLYAERQIHVSMFHLHQVQTTLIKKDVRPLTSLPCKNLCTRSSINRLNHGHLNEHLLMYFHKSTLFQTF